MGRTHPSGGIHLAPAPGRPGRHPPRAGRTWAIAILALFAARAVLAQDVDPALHFRTMRTEHFIVHFHQDEERLAPRLAAIAERTWQRFATTHTTPPPGQTHVVLTDQSDQSNGYATPLPRNTIVIYAAAPGSAGFLNAPDWLEVVFVHEFTHIVHLDQSAGWARLARRVFGRAPWVFPNLLLPTWQVEGLATYEESRQTGAGRMHAGDFTAIVAEAARAGRVAPIDRVNGGLTDWPGGQAAYAYGLGFHAYLAGRFGVETLDALSRATSGSLPWLGSRAFRRVYGAPLGSLWNDYVASLNDSARDVVTLVDTPTPRRLTHHGYTVLGPRYVRSACATCTDEVVYTVRTPHEFPALYRVRLDTLATRRIATQYLGSTAAPGPSTIYFDQQEIRRNVGLYSDVYALDPTNGRVTSLTRDARVLEPDFSTAQHRLVAVRNRAGQRDLVTIDVERPAVDPNDVVIAPLVAEDEVQFNAPRWSPDGQFVAAERRRRGHHPEIVVVDVAARTVRVVASGAAVRWTAPAWRPDGRALVAAAAPGDDPFNLYEIDVASGTTRQITHTTGGATSPDIAPDGASIVYAGYGADGFDLYEIPYPRATPVSGAGAVDRSAGGAAATAITDTRPETAVADGTTPYRPWRTLLPTSWTPLLETSDDRLRAGAVVAGSDVLGYHAWAAAATWPVLDGDDKPTPDHLPDWQASYVYRRWRPQVWTTVARDTALFEGVPTDTGLAVPLTRVERSVEAGIQLPARHVRFSHIFQASVAHIESDYRQGETRQTRDRSAARLVWTFSSARHFGDSISPERGITFGATTEMIRRVLGASADATTFTADARAYLPGPWAHHVLALRAAGGTTTGQAGAARVFLLGGGSANTAVSSLGSDAMSLLRGFPTDLFAGRHIGVVNVDYRFPIARPQRGLGTWPLFLHTIHGAVYVDAGHVWSRSFSRNDLKTSIGGELSADVVLGFGLPLTATIGAAWGQDGSGAVPSQGATYARVGYAF